jgi:tetratricopeptide (TPR) repeat protein
VPTEPAISEDFEPYDDEKEFRRLVRAVKFSKKHYLHFVCCNQVPKQNELIEKTKKNLEGKKIKVVKFKKPITDLLGELQKKTIGKDCEAVFVQGLEYSISSDGKGDENALIYNLNISRDAFKKYLSCPLFLWIPEYAIVKIARHASDFYSVRSGTFYFSNPPEQVTEQIFQSVSSSWVETSSLPLEEKLKKIESLETLLAEYRGLHKEKQNKKTEVRLLLKIGSFFDSISEYRKATKYLKQVLKISREIGSPQDEIAGLGNLGNIYRSLGEYRKAINYFKKTLTLSKKIHNLQNQSASLINLGLVYAYLGEYQKAIDYQEQALAINREMSNRLEEATCLGNLGLTYWMLNDYQKAIDYQEQALAIRRKLGSRLGEAASLGDLGNVYSSLGEYRKAIKFQEEAFKIFHKTGYREGEGKCLGNLGNVHHNLGENEKACAFWRKALAIFEAIESPLINKTRRSLEENCQK